MIISVIFHAKRYVHWRIGSGAANARGHLNSLAAFNTLLVRYEMGSIIASQYWCKINLIIGMSEIGF